ncbi:MAG TPA: DUF2089 domain-containing protein [Anaerolineaceae bacterium]|nr:DUF2089 domain-containing protein [Anaerolineaceae bacterium]
MNPMFSKCPVCGGELTITRLHCDECDTTIEGHFTPPANLFGQLNPEQMQFLLNFVRLEGRFTRMEEELNLSYPTLRNRLYDIIRALGFEPGKEEAVQRLTENDRRHILEDLEAGRISFLDAQRRLKGKREEEDAPSGEVV